MVELIAFVVHVVFGFVLFESNILPVLHVFIWTCDFCKNVNQVTETKKRCNFVNFVYFSLFLFLFHVTCIVT